MTIEVKLEYVPTDTLTPSPDNPRRHPRSQIRQLTKAIRELGFINPIIVNLHWQIVAGHARHRVAQILNIPLVPIIQIDHLSEVQLRAYRLADNKLVENGEWDPDLIRIEIELLIENNVDLEIAGFSAPEVDLHLQAMPVSELQDPPCDNPSDIEDPITESGDEYQLGPHGILCADIRQLLVIQQFLGDIKVDAVFTDPPYNVRIGGHVSGLGSHNHSDARARKMGGRL